MATAELSDTAQNTLTRNDTEIEVGIATPKNQQYEVAHNEQNDSFPTSINNQATAAALTTNNGGNAEQVNKKTLI